MNRFDSLYPATVKEYLADKRLCRIEIEGITEGGDDLPLAEIVYPIGDKQDDTELEILPKDKVWVSFINNDPTYPVIIGARASNEGNFVDTRHYHHKNIRLDADETIKNFVLDDTEVTITDGTITLRVKGNSVFLSENKALISVNGSTFELTGAKQETKVGGNTVTTTASGTTTNQNITSSKTVTGTDDVKGGGKSLKSHTHKLDHNGTRTTTPPN